MGAVFDLFGSIPAAPEVTYGVEVVPTDALTVTGEPDSTHDDSFPEEELLRLSSSGRAPARQHNKLDLSFNVTLGPMADVINGRPSWHPIMVATGHTWAQAGVAGAGNYIEYKPKSAGFGSATLYTFLKEDGAGLLSILKHLGSRGTFTFSIEGGSGPQLQVELSALHSFNTPFSALTAPTTHGLNLDPRTYTGKCWSVTLDSGLGPEPAKLISFSLARNNEVTANEDDLTACADGVAEIEVEPGTITGTLVIEFEASHVAAAGPANYWREAHDADTDYEVVVARDDGVRRFSVTIPVARFGDIQQGTGDGRRQLTMAFTAQPTVSDDEYLIRDEVL